MKKFILVLILSSIASLASAESVRLFGGEVNALTDAAPTLTRYVVCREFQDVHAFVNIDKGATVTITPVLNSDNSLEGPISSTMTIANGGADEVALYSRIGSPKAKVVITKTEAGTTSIFSLNIFGGR